MDTKNIQLGITNYEFNEEDDNECTPEDCWCSHYDNPYDNYYYSHRLNPAEQYFWWIQEWKREFREIHEDCRKLGINSYSDDYVKGVLDASAPFTPLNKFEDDEGSKYELEDTLKNEIRDWMIASD